MTTKELEKLSNKTLTMNYTQLLAFCNVILSKASYINGDGGIFSPQERIGLILMAEAVLWACVQDLESMHPNDADLGKHVRLLVRDGTLEFGE